MPPLLRNQQKVVPYFGLCCAAFIVGVFLWGTTSFHRQQQPILTPCPPQGPHVFFQSSSIVKEDTTTRTSSSLSTSDGIVTLRRLGSRLLDECQCKVCYTIQCGDSETKYKPFYETCPSTSVCTPTTVRVPAQDACGTWKHELQSLCDTPEALPSHADIEWCVSTSSIKHLPDRFSVLRQNDGTWISVYARQDGVSAAITS
eukprot:PhF_6_TR26050/c0_g1_i2/m.36683